MLNFLKKRKHLIGFCLILIISSLIIFSLGAKEANAAEGSPGWFVGEIQTVIGGILLGIQEIIGGLVAWFAGLAQGILGYTDTQNAQMVKDGWKIVRDLVNMFFVLILLVIAFATILRFETYGMKALLPKLIIAALLINFSLVLAGTIIDFSGVLTNFFIQDSTSFFNNIAGSMGLAKLQLTNAEQPSQYWQCNDVSEITIVQYPNKQACEADCSTGTCSGPIPTPPLNWAKIPGDKFWKVAASLFLSIIFTTIAAFVFGAFAFLLLVRVIIIWFLLILAPLAWFFWILPSTQHLFEQWWKAFMKWVFFAPAAIFFIWLSVSSWVKFISGAAPSVGGEMISGMKKVITDEITQAKIMPQVMLPENFIQFILACGMLIGSLIVAQKMSITFADKAVAWGKGAAGGMTKGAGRWIGKRTQMAASERAGKIGMGLGKAGELMKGVRGLKTIGRLTGQAGKGARAFEEMERAAFAEAENQYKDRTTENLKMDFKTANPRNKAAIGKILAGRKDGFKDFKEKEINNMIALAKRYGKEDDILKSRPDLIPSTKGIDPKDGEKAKEAIREIIRKMKPKDGENLQIEAIGEQGKGQTDEQKWVQEIITEQMGERGNLNKDFLVKLSETNPTVNVKIMKDIVEPNIDKMSSDIKKYVEGTPGKAATGDKKIVVDTSISSESQKFSDEERAKMLKT